MGGVIPPRSPKRSISYSLKMESAKSSGCQMGDEKPVVFWIWGKAQDKRQDKSLAGLPHQAVLAGSNKLHAIIMIECLIT